jgi:NAD-dependent deacetylase
MSGKIVFYSGAGVSAESGISTWRDPDNGIWSKYDPNIVCNIDNIWKHHDQFLAFMNERQRMYAECKPNAAHTAIARLQQELPDRVFCITQNIDHLFEEAGCISVDHLHGDFSEMHCKECSHVWPISKDKIFTRDDVCANCGSILVKPNIVVFGEPAPRYAQLIDFCYNLNENDIFVMIGTSGNVIPTKWVVGQTKTGKLPYRILCNMQPEIGVSNHLFDTCFFGPVTAHIDDIIALVKNKIK